MSDYQNAKSKLEKSAIISSIVDQVRSNSRIGGFVRKDPLTGQLSEVGDFLAVSLIWGVFQPAPEAEKFGRSEVQDKVNSHPIGFSSLAREDLTSFA